MSLSFNSTTFQRSGQTEIACEILKLSVAAGSCCYASQLVDKGSALRFFTIF